MLSITGGTVLLDADGLVPADLVLREGLIDRVGDASGARLDATGLLVLPGIVDLHGDAFERQLQPRPGVGFPADLALRDTGASAVGGV
jgi:alpha-D-ribose 1-methylphosphonate 5-triphosphate diphosphatase